MTAIIGYANGTTVWIGGDSSAQNSVWTRLSICERKVWRNQEMLLGGSGRWRVIQLMQALLRLPEHPAELNSSDYLVAHFIPALQELLKAHNEVMQNEDGGTGLVIGYRGVIYHIDSAFNVNAMRSQIIHDGSGGDAVNGAFRAFMTCGLSVEDAMLKALEVAGEIELTVAPPYYVLSV